MALICNKYYIIWILIKEMPKSIRNIHINYINNIESFMKKKNK